MKQRFLRPPESKSDRRCFIGGSDAHVIMGQDNKAVIRPRQDKPREIDPVDLSGNLIVQFGLTTEGINRTWYERNPGPAISAPAGSIDRRHLPSLISHLAGDVAGALADAADNLAAGGGQ